MFLPDLLPIKIIFYNFLNQNPFFLSAWRVVQDYEKIYQEDQAAKYFGYLTIFLEKTNSALKMLSNKKFILVRLPQGKLTSKGFENYLVKFSQEADKKKVNKNLMKNQVLYILKG
jgi:hypothetical protein